MRPALRCTNPNVLKRNSDFKLRMILSATETLSSANRSETT
ncbi:hypothetical protein [Leptospira borgpetersenii]|nr:hypothetical protein [Leptospira borgpetersenii]